MFIELTDHLRCPEAHEEAFLVLLPDRMDGRRVTAGHLGCPVCGWGVDWTDGVLSFGEVDAPAHQPSPLDATGAVSILGLSGPGGWVALAGRACLLGGEIGDHLPGVSIVAINPPAEFELIDNVSVVNSPVWPLKKGSMRGILLGADATEFNDRAIASVLSGLCIAGETAPPVDGPGHELLQVTPGLWLARRR